MSTLHITNWYPNRWNPLQAQFIKDQFEAISRDGNHRLLHVEVRYGEGFPRLFWGSYSDNERFLILYGARLHHRLVEVFTALLLIGVRFRLLLGGFHPFWGAKWDTVHVHIAWPLLRFPALFGILFGRNYLLTEHWSAYHENFDLPVGGKAQKRLANIFRDVRIVVAVSNALARDIRNFTASPAMRIAVIPDVVGDMFRPSHDSRTDDGTVFLMASFWTPLKCPLLVINAFAALHRDHPDIRLRIAGDGEQLKNMVHRVRRLRIEAAVSFLGRMQKPELAGEMRGATAFLHASRYETFSLVCAEALSCGTPVVASRVGGIPELVNRKNGILVDDGQMDWIAALASFHSKASNFDRGTISLAARERFSAKAAGDAYRRVYGELTEYRRS